MQAVEKEILNQSRKPGHRGNSGRLGAIVAVRGADEANMSAVSQAAKDHQAQARKELDNWYKSAGICLGCHKLYARPGRIHCPACAQKKLAKVMSNGDNAAKCKERRERLKAEGRCERCGKTSRPGKTLCAKCAKKNSESQQVARIKKRLQKEAAHDKTAQCV